MRFYPHAVNWRLLGHWRDKMILFPWMELGINPQSRRKCKWRRRRGGCRLSTCKWWGRRGCRLSRCCNNICPWWRWRACKWWWWSSAWRHYEDERRADDDDAAARDDGAIFIFMEFLLLIWRRRCKFLLLICFYHFYIYGVSCFGLCTLFCLPFFRRDSTTYGKHEPFNRLKGTGRLGESKGSGVVLFLFFMFFSYRLLISLYTPFSCLHFFFIKSKIETAIHHVL